MFIVSSFALLQIYKNPPFLPFSSFCCIFSHRQFYLRDDGEGDSSIKNKPLPNQRTLHVVLHYTSRKSILRARCAVERSIPVYCKDRETIPNKAHTTMYATKTAYKRLYRSVQRREKNMIITHTQRLLLIR